MYSRRLSWVLRRTREEIAYSLLLTVLNSLCGAPLLPAFLRPFAYRLVGMDMRANRVYPGCWFSGPKVSVGAGSILNTRCHFEATAPITIGERAQLGMEVLVCTATHALSAEERRSGETLGRPVSIGDGCWIGARAMILPGVTIGDGTVIAAGAVVTKDCEPNAVYAGVPARLVRTIDA